MNKGQTRVSVSIGDSEPERACVLLIRFTALEISIAVRHHVFCIDCCGFVGVFRLPRLVHMYSSLRL